MFSDFAPAYWLKGMPAIPLRPKMKVPAINAWSQFANQMPTQAQMDAWLEAYPDGNIGLPLGPQAGLVGLDLDSEDPRVLKLLERLMPETPWKRVGKKGAVFAFKYNGERTYRIKDEANNTILELLSGGTQIVLPPSIHPDTGRPYEATGHLWELVERLPALPSDFEQRVRDGLIELGFKLTSRGRAKVSEWTPAGARDSAMISNAGILARAVMRGERSLLEALHEMETWCASYVERVAGDPIDMEKGKAKIMEFVQRDLADGRHALPPLWSKGMTDEELSKTKTLFGEDKEEWTCKQILEELEEGFKPLGLDDTTGRTLLVETTLRRVAKSPTLTEIDHDVIIRYIANLNGKLTTTASLRKRLRELMNADMVGSNHSDITMALLKELERDGEVRFHTTRFYRWAGSHWKELDETLIYDTLRKEFGHLPAAKKFNDLKGIIQLLSKICAKPLKEDLETNGINFANGFLTSDMEMLPHDARLGCTYVLPYRYLPDGAAPQMWLGLLDQCWSGETDYQERVQALREAIAATLFGVASQYARAFCLYGVAHSGKSTILNVIQGLIPRDASSSVPPHDWSDKFLPTQMEGKLINFCGELSESQLINGASFKQIVEGAEISGQFKGKDIFKFRPTCAQWFAGNHIPRSRDTSEGFARRWLFWHFSRKCPPELKRVNLVEEILSEEREAVVAWAVPAIQELMRREDYTLPRCHEVIVGDVENQNNSVRQFLTGGDVVIGEGRMTEESKLYADYYSYCKVMAGVAPVGRARFRLSMKELGSKFRFEIRLERTAGGVETVNYVGVGVRGARKAA